MTASTSLKRRLVLLCDEFDEPFRELDDRVFLNLRALKDRYPQDICYVTATGQRLRDMRREHGAAEFAELFAHNIRFLHPLGRSDAIDFIQSIIGEGDVTLMPEEINFIWEQATGAFCFWHTFYCRRLGHARKGIMKCLCVCISGRLVVVMVTHGKHLFK